uniref:type II secretion system F family protein n=1 Tax=Halomonas sp. TaxID=1486246 RepID=UPI002611282B|nr:type II secretion system F family protein [Halomonas sp.]
MKHVNRWQWKGRGPDGRYLSGEIEASSKASVLRVLRTRRIKPLSIRRTDSRHWRLGQRSITALELTLFTRQLETLLKSRVPILQALEVIAHSLVKPSMRAMLQKLIADVSHGASLSEALARHPRQFDTLYISMIEAGELAGTLDSMLDRLATYQEKHEALKQKVKKAMWYPLSVIAIGLIVTFILLVVVIPKFEDMFTGFGATLPPLTQMTLRLSDLTQQHGGLALGILVASSWLMRLAMQRSTAIHSLMSRMVLRIPILGKVLEHSAIARFSRTLATTYGSGVPLLDGLAIAAGSTGNPLLHAAIQDMRDELASGHSLHVAMHHSGQFPALAIQMIKIGEEAGALEAMLSQVATYYEDEVERRVDTLTSLLEPMVILVLGIVTGGLVMSMYLPIFELGSVL